MQREGTDSGISASTRTGDRRCAYRLRAIHAPAALFAAEQIDETEGRSNPLVRDDSAPAHATRSRALGPHRRDREGPTAALIADWTGRGLACGRRARSFVRGPRVVRRLPPAASARLPQVEGPHAADTRRHEAPPPGRRPPPRSARG